MTVIEQLVEALKYHTAQTRPIQQTIEAIAAGEAELRREPVAWRSWYIDSNNYVIWQQKPSSTTFMLEPLYTREETK